jgi:extradiol dioxygenase family protein
MQPSFHLSLNVGSLEESSAFFTELLGGTVSHKDPGGYVNIDLYGTQITLTAGAVPQGLQGFHFGINLGIADFDAIAARIMESGYRDVLSAPQIVDANTPLERKKMYLRCPAGYRVELKGYGVSC